MLAQQTSYKWGETTPISTVITTAIHLFSAIYRGYFTPLITESGAHLVGKICFMGLLRRSVQGKGLLPLGAVTSSDDFFVWPHSWHP